VSTRYSYGSYLRQAAEKGRKAMTKATTKTERVVKPMKSTQGVIRRPTPGVEAFGASNKRVVPTTRLEKDGAITGVVPSRGSK
jgi:hypothetical protein